MKNLFDALAKLKTQDVLAWWIIHAGYAALVFGNLDDRSKNHIFDLMMIVASFYFASKASEKKT
jgi:hypothetical protein